MSPSSPAAAPAAPAAAQGAAATPEAAPAAAPAAPVQTGLHPRIQRLQGEKARQERFRRLARRHPLLRTLLEEHAALQGSLENLKAKGVALDQSRDELAAQASRAAKDATDYAVKLEGEIAARNRDAEAHRAKLIECAKELDAAAEREKAFNALAKDLEQRAKKAESERDQARAELARVRDEKAAGEKSTASKKKPADGDAAAETEKK